MIKKVLIIAYFWPYRNGSGRVIGLARHLPEFGWQPIILTAPLNERPDPGFLVIETHGYNPKEDVGVQIKKRLNLTSGKSYSYIKPFLSFLYKFYQEIINYPDAEKGWRPFVIRAGSRLLQKEDIDAMISIWPVTSHLVAKELKNKYNIPWIADFPDLWSQNHNYSHGPIRKFFDRKLEIKTILTANVLTTVSDPWAKKLRMLHKQKLVYAINHGFDPTELNMPPTKLTSKFTITYTGQIYRGKQDPSKLFAALRDLISERFIDSEDVELRFYGPRQEWLTGDIEKYRLPAIVKRYGVVPREISFKKQRESQLLLLLNWEDYRVKGWHSLKIYEYLAAQRPVLVTGGFGNDVIKDLLDETRAGMYCKNIEEIKNILKRLYLEYKHQGKVNYAGEIEKINKYSYREMARKFAEVVDDLNNNRRVC